MISPLFVGTDRLVKPAANITLNPATLLRHMMSLGSSGSGKTVLCKVVVEEFVRHGLPVICIDPQGDICSLALNAKSTAFLEEKGIAPSLVAEFASKADVVLFSPASRKGIALSADPFNIDLLKLSDAEQIYAITSVATMIVSLLGYDLTTDDGAGLVAVFDRSLSQLASDNQFPHDLEQFTTWLLKLDNKNKEALSRFLDVKKIDHACQKLARLDVGARRLLFHEGIALNIDLLLGRGERAAAVKGKTRVSVICLNSLNSQEDKEFFIAALAQQLYTWMLQNPSDVPQALFYIDEIAPFMPPVRIPSSKPGLMLLCKQARKYGICCLMATQNPGDVDYKAMAQFGTWAIGRLTTRQDMAKVQPTVKSLDPVNVTEIMEELPALRPGQFILISPDNFKNTHRLQTRWLLTEHETMNEEAIERLCNDRFRARFDGLEALLKNKKNKSRAKRVSDPSAEPVAKAIENISEDVELGANGEDKSVVIGEVADDAAVDLADAASKLSLKASVSVAEFSLLLKKSEYQARTLLQKLINAKLAQTYKNGRVQRYWSVSSQMRPDLGLVEPVPILTMRVTQQNAEAIGQKFCNNRILEIFGAGEQLVRTELEYRLVLQIKFIEKIKRAFYKKLTSLDFSESDVLVDNVYLHPTNLKFVRYVAGKGVKLLDDPGEYASKVNDFDGATTIEKASPAALKFDINELQQCKNDDLVREVFKQRFNASPKEINKIFMPVYSLHLAAKGGGSNRIMLIDGFNGKPLEW